jgi:hydrogenase maturation protein HypF
MDYRPMVRQIVSDKNDIPHSIIADAFHAAIADYAVKIARKAGIKDVLLTGGVMQNKVLVEKIVTGLENAGHRPYMHQHTPPNDGGIATGQLLSLVKKTI